MLQTNTGHVNDELYNKRQASIFTAGLAGILAGAAGVTALILSDKILRKRIVEKTKSMKNYLMEWSSEKLHTVDQQSATAGEMISENEDMLQNQQEIKMKN